MAERKREEVRNKLIKKEWGLADEKKRKKEKRINAGCIVKLCIKT